MWWLWIVGYVAGFAITFRHFVLGMVETMERARDERNGDRSYAYPPMPGAYRMEGLDYSIAGFGALVWPLIWIAGGFWKLIFPKGVKTKYGKEKQHEAKLKEAEAALKKSQEEIRRLSEEMGLKIPEGM